MFLLYSKKSSNFAGRITPRWGFMWNQIYVYIKKTCYRGVSRKSDKE